jgi:hypothetical protein
MRPVLSTGPVTASFCVVREDTVLATAPHGATSLGPQHLPRASLRASVHECWQDSGCPMPQGCHCWCAVELTGTANSAYVRCCAGSACTHLLPSQPANVPAQRQGASHVPLQAPTQALTAAPQALANGVFVLVLLQPSQIACMS